MNATAREGIAYLETFYDALERANVVALADLHRERVLAAAREQGVHPSKVVVSSLELDQTLLRPAVPALSALRRASFGEKGAFSADAAEEKKKAPKREGSFKGVTLLLFDGDGEHRHTLSGPNSAENLERAFRQHLGRRADS